MPSAARICCLDLDTFFVSVERLLDPSLAGRPVIVGGRPGQRGVVTACSYEVRRLGVRSGMSMTDAERLAPQAVYLPTRHGVYGPYAQQVREVVERFSPVVQAASIDEFFIDFRGCERLYRLPGDASDDATIERTVRRMRKAIQDELGLPASAGIGATRAVAKMASGLAKPAGVLMVPAGVETRFVDSLPARRFPGIGPVAENRLLGMDIHTLGELLAVEGGPQWLLDMVATVRAGLDPQRTADLGRDRPAFREHDPEGVAVGSISNERTFMADVDDRPRLRSQVLALTERVCWRARRRRALARTITLKLRWADFVTISRSRTVAPTNDDARVYSCVADLLETALDRPLAVRLVGVALSNLEEQSPQLGLPFRGHLPVGPALDAVRERFGYDAIRVGAAPVPAEKDRHASDDWHA